MDTRSTFYQFILNMVQSNFSVERRGRIGHPCTIRKGQRPARFLSSFHRPQRPVPFNILRLLSMCKCDDHSDNFWPQLHRHDSVSVCSCFHARAKWFSRSLSVSLGVCPCACPMWCNMPQLGSYDMMVILAFAFRVFSMNLFNPTCSDRSLSWCFWQLPVKPTVVV